jgi:hypothetical protein
MHEVFLSYSRHDSTAANALADTLSAAGLSVWLDRNAIQEGDAFDTQIEEAIAQTRVVIVIWSRNSVKSHWVRAEAAYALNKQKLLPIAIDQSEPPLQFMQIQTIDFRYWDHTNKHHAFQQLAAALAKRLEPAAAASEGAPKTLSPAQTLSALSAGPADGPLMAKLHGWLAAIGLHFPEKVIEKEFHDYFRERTYSIAQFCMALGIATYLTYGLADMAMESGGVYSTRFRFMVAAPLMVAFFALSFRPFARRHSQLFICTFVFSGVVCTYISVLLIGMESPFRIETGNATMNAMLMLGFVALIPFNLAYTFVIGLFISVLHAAVTIYMAVPLSTSWLFYLHVTSMLTVACCIAYWRERFYRLAFAAELAQPASTALSRKA